MGTNVCWGQNMEIISQLWTLAKAVTYSFSCKYHFDMYLLATFWLDYWEDEFFTHHYYHMEHLENLQLWIFNMVKISKNFAGINFCEWPVNYNLPKNLSCRKKFYQQNFLFLKYYLEGIVKEQLVEIIKEHFGCNI